MRSPICYYLFTLLAIIIFTQSGFTQEPGIKDLEFLIGTWEIREDNEEKTWWEKATRTGQYTLDSSYIELVSQATSSSGKTRSYRWFIHYNSKAKQFEMISMFGNWHKVQFDLLYWDPENRKLTIKNGEDLPPKEYHERLGELVFDEDFNGYTWTGENKYGDPNEPSIWKYVEVGKRKE